MEVALPEPLEMVTCLDVDIVFDDKDVVSYSLRADLGDTMTKTREEIEIRLAARTLRSLDGQTRIEPAETVDIERSQVRRIVTRERMVPKQLPQTVEEMLEKLMAEKPPTEAV